LHHALNTGLLPPAYYALIEQHFGTRMADALARTPSPLTSPDTIQALRRTLANRHVRDYHLVAIVEIVSPANKDRAAHVEVMAEKIADALEFGVHVLLVDLFPPRPADPHGLHGAVWERFANEPSGPPAEGPLTLASYVAAAPPEAYLEHLAVGAVLPDMPLFLHRERYVNTPLEATYQAAYRGVPAFWRDVLEGNSAAP
jgi:hypothetical protein